MKRELKAKLAGMAVLVCAGLGMLCAGFVHGDDTTAAAQQPAQKDAVQEPQKEFRSSPRMKRFHGIVEQVEPTEKMLTAKYFWGTRRFSLADNCAIALEDKATASLQDLHVGQKIAVRYENANGVLIARAIQQRDMVYHGTVDEIAPDGKSIEIKHGVMVRSFALPENCTVLGKDTKPASLKDLKVGEIVDVTFEERDSNYVARRIEQKFPSFTGTIRALDDTTRTVKARSFGSDKVFRLADGCRIVTANNPKASLRDLRLGERVEFNYEDVDGVLIANRIGHESGTTEAPSMQSTETAKIVSRSQ